MDFGVFFELSVPRPFTGDIERRVYENALEHVRVADALGGFLTARDGINEVSDNGE